MAPDSQRWRVLLRWVIPTLALSLVFLFIGQLANFYGSVVVAYSGVAFLLSVLAIFLLYMHAWIGELETRTRALEKGANREGAESLTPPVGDERERLRQQLRELLDQIPGLQVSNDRPRLRLWRRQCLARLEKAYGGYTSEVEDFEGINFNHTDAALDEAGAILTVAIEIHLA